MRAALAAILLTIATQAGAECGSFCDRDWLKTATETNVQDLVEVGVDVMGWSRVD